MIGWDDVAFRGQVQTELDAFLQRQAETLVPLGGDAALLVERARASVHGGKRFRAAFCLWGYGAVAGLSTALTPSPELLRACAALELLHASALVHDDYMDGSDTRRGEPSSHRFFEAHHADAGWRGPSTTYGAAGAILLGDLLLAWADELLRTSGFGWEVLGPGLRVLDICRTEVIAGQFLDVSVQARAAADVATAMTVLRFKSAKYSVERPLHLGAALAGATPAQLEALTAFGLPIGEAFQLRDDVLGVFGDPATTGKPAGDDLVEGKRTVLVAHTLELADEADARFVDQALGTTLAPAEIDRVRAIMEECGALAAVERTISELTESALAALRASDLDQESGAVLVELARAATQRQV